MIKILNRYEHGRLNIKLPKKKYRIPTSRIKSRDIHVIMGKNNCCFNQRDPMETISSSYLKFVTYY